MVFDLCIVRHKLQRILNFKYLGVTINRANYYRNEKKNGDSR